MALLWLIPKNTEGVKDNTGKESLSRRVEFGSLWIYQVQRYYYHNRYLVRNNKITSTYCILDINERVWDYYIIQEENLITQKNPLPCLTKMRQKTTNTALLLICKEFGSTSKMNISCISVFFVKKNPLCVCVCFLMTNKVILSSNLYLMYVCR